MTLDFFYENYDLEDLEVKSAFVKNNRLVLDVIVVAKLELIANGYRPEMDVEHEIEFSFGYNSADLVIDSPIINGSSYSDGTLLITVNDRIYKINDNNVIVTQKE